LIQFGCRKTKFFYMNEHAKNRESSFKEIVIAKNLTVVHMQADRRQHPHEKYKTWVMPPIRERYIKHKKHDPL
jgi:hypothetical protein